MTIRHASLLAVACVGALIAPGCSLTTHFDDFRPGDTDAGIDGGDGDSGGRDAQPEDAQPSDDAEIDAPILDGAMPDAPLPDGGPDGVLLDVMLAGDGAGTITSDDSRISCGTTCAALYDSTAATMVTLTALAEAGTSDFTGWTGACTGTDPTCTVTMDAARTVTATFTRRHYQLVVSLSGDGAGTVTDMPGSIVCDGTPAGTCMVEYAAGTEVVLTAMAGAASTFGGWSGPCSGTGTCTFTILEDTTVGASFDRDRRSLSVMLAGTGSGSVASAPAGIDCGTTCSASYPDGTMVTLTATPSSDSTFTGWSGACTGTGTCVVTMDMAQMVTATFALRRYTLTIARSGTGTGTVISTAPLGTINCGSTCTTMQDHGFAILLQANPSMGSTFEGFSGGGCDAGVSTCLVTLTADTTITATFSLQQFPVTVGFVSTDMGTGTVTSAPAGISCTTGGATGCMSSFAYNTMVTLTATPSVGSEFVQWTGDCAGASTTCVVTASAARNVTAEFRRRRYTITASTSGDGTGSITSSVGGINCPGTCTADVSHGTSVTFTANRTAPNNFAGWGGDCASFGTMTTCTIPITAATTVTASFTLSTSVLTVTRSGNGRVTATGIDCGSDCNETYTAGTMVTLSQMADPGWMFSGWSGACSGTGACSITMGASPIGVTATFVPMRHTLTVNRTGTGTGGSTVSSSPIGIACPPAAGCNADFDHGTLVTLTATPDASATFTGWGGSVPASCTSSTGPCTVTMDMARTVTANFTLKSYVLDVQREGGGTGGVASTMPAGAISCGADCTETLTHGTSVSLTAAAGTGSNFASWTAGPCMGSTAATCAFTMTGATTARAAFELNRYALTVTKVGMGTVTSSPMGINCGPTCSAQYDHGTSVTLSAMPAVGFRFGGWSGGGCTGTGTCVVAMTAARNVTATFIRQVTLRVEVPDVGGIPVTSTDGNINCRGDGLATGCSFVYDAGTTVVLEENVPKYAVLTGFSGCTPAGTGCSVTLTADATVTVAIDLLGNLAFATSTTYSGNIGGVSRADDECAARAAAALLPPVTYRAWLSTATQSAYDRIDSVSGWVRPDGLPVSYDARDLVQGAIRHPINLAEDGTFLAPGGISAAWTGTLPDGTISPERCTDWTSAGTSVSGISGHIQRGSGAWTATFQGTLGTGGSPCSSMRRLYCFGVDRSYPAVSPPALPSDVGYIFPSVTRFNAGAGLSVMDTACDDDASNAGYTGNYVAFVGHMSSTGVWQSAGSRVTSFRGDYYRPDGWRIGSYDQVVAATARLDTFPTFQPPFGITGNPVPIDNVAGWSGFGVWTGMLGASGSTPLTPPSMNNQTCANWSMSSAMGFIGDPAGTSYDRWASYVQTACMVSTWPMRPVYCIRAR